MVTMLDVQERWETHSKFKRRALGGRVALDGFHYQFAVSLTRFFAAVLSGEAKHTDFGFEGLSDLSEVRGDLVYLIQIKTTLKPESFRKALREAIAVDEFLEECFPALRQQFRFEITTRGLRGNVQTDPATLSATDVGLDTACAERWNSLRARCSPIVVDSAPELRLAIRLWKDNVTRPTALIDRCVGRLLAMVSARARPSEIGRTLMSLWEAERHEKSAPVHLLGAADLVSRSTSEHRRIVHSVRPGIQDLSEGCFMERAARLEVALSIVRDRWAANAKEPQRRIPVFWIRGPSGAGKSVLLLQLARELVSEGDVDAVNFVESYAGTVPRALDYASDTSTDTLIVGDDLYSPNNRDPAVWAEVGVLSATKNFPGRCAILTCGPLEQLQAFRHECERHRSLDLTEIMLGPLDCAERSAYHTWYQERTGARVPLSGEPIFAAVAWTYELHREEKLTVYAFAKRFDQRLQELELRTAGHAALALNLYGLNAPEALFASKRPELAQFRSERIWRLANPGTGNLTGRFFHPQISRLIYEALALPGENLRLAEDIARGFDAMLEDGEGADAFLNWLGPRKIGKSRTGGGLQLDESMRVEILRALWPIFRRRGATEDALPRLLRWQQAARHAGIDLVATGIKKWVHAWWRDLDESARPWALLFQMVWDAADEADLPALAQTGTHWLDMMSDTTSWPWVYNRLIQFSPGDAALRSLGLRWLADHRAHTSWPGVWGGLFATRDSLDATQTGEPATLLRLALEAIPVQPESDADLKVWERTVTLGPPMVEFANAVVRKLVTARSPYKIEKGVDFLLRHIQAGQLLESLSPAMQETMPGCAWAFVWRHFQRKCPSELDLLPLGRDWLRERENRPEWYYVWQQLIDRGFECGTLLPLGRDWLRERADRPEWYYVWQTLIDQRFERKTLLPLGRDWLREREGRPEWAYVWRKLVDKKFERETLLPLGRDWLRERENQAGWYLVANLVPPIR